MGFFRNLFGKVFGRGEAPKRPGFFSKERRAERKRKKEERKKARQPEKPTIQDRVKEQYPSEWGPTWESEREERLKAKDQEWRKEQQKKSFKAFHKNYGLDISTYNEMFDAIGGAMDDLAMYLDGGSPTVVEIYRYYRKEFKGDPDEFVDMINTVKEENPGLNQEELVDRIYFEMGREKEAESFHG